VEYGKAQVEVKLAALRKEGVALKAEDLAPKPVPEAENAALLYVKAGDLLEGRTKSHRDSQASVEYYRPRDLNDPAKAARYIEANADVLAMVRKAADMPHCVFSVDWRDPLAAVTPYAWRMSRLSRLVALRACQASRAGDQSEALDLLRVGFVMARRMNEHSQLTDQIVAWAIDHATMEAAFEIVGRGGLTEAKAGELAEELRRVDYVGGLNRAVQFDGAEGLWLFDLLRKDPDAFIRECVSDSDDRAALQKAIWRAYATVLRPLTYADEMTFLERMEKVRAASKLPARDSARQWREIRTEGQDLPPLASMADEVAGLPDRSVFRRDEAIARRALVGAVLGVELCRQKMGRYPATLDDVRKTLDWKIAEDPFSGKDLVYKQVGETYLLYSIGEDLKDDGGTPTWDDLQAVGEAKGKRPSAAEAQRGDIVWMGTWKGRK
jgi:hypothetical protein